tara:strand:+ start:2685 stop:3905 length:1221 start_codon:yes stop_codon:yes gene_type:complete
MKNLLLIILLSAFVTAQDTVSNVNSYNTNVVVRPVNDEIEVITFVEIFNRNLQFIKIEEGFESSFEVTVSLVSKDSNKLFKTTFSDSINVKNFSETVKMSKPRIIVNKFLIPYGEFDINFSLKDLDTKLVGKKQTKVPSKNLSSNRNIKIFEPIFVIHKDGDWNFGLDKYPLKLNKIASKDGFIEFYQYIYFEEKGEYLINISLVSEDGEWKKSFIEKVTSNNIEKLIKAPLKGIETSNLKIKVDISKDSNVISKSFPIKLKNDILIFSNKSNISKALNQMNYILDSDEKKELRNLKNSEKENFFKKVWAKRDPDLTTKENELMEEYYRRVNFSEENFSKGSSQGWRSDMGMIYILFGKPDDIVKSMNPQQSYNFETWYYFQINEEFVFIDEYGFGNFRLRTQFLN